MLEAIGFDNYRIFDKETIINLKPITILTGPNSSGKSSVIKAAKLLKQNSMELNFGFPIDLNFVPDNFGHNLSEISKILTESNSETKDKQVSFILPLDYPYMPQAAFGKLTYGINNINNRKGIFMQLSILFKINGKLETAMILSADNPRQFFKDHYTRALINFGLIIDVFINKFLPLLNEVEVIVTNNKNNLEPKQMAQHVKNLPHFGEEIVDRPKYIYPVRDYFYKSIKPEEWRKFEKSKPVLPFYKFFISTDNDSEISENLCQDAGEDYYKILNIYKELMQTELAKIIKKIGIDPKVLKGSHQRKIFYDYFKNYESKLFDYIVGNSLWIPFVHAPSRRKEKSQKSMIQWGGITDKFDILVNENILSTSFEKLFKFSSFKNLDMLRHLFDYYTNYSEPNNYIIIKEFIETMVWDSERQLFNVIQEHFFYDSNRIEQVLFYHNSNSPFGYDLLSRFDEFVMKEQNPKFSKQENIINDQLKFLGIADEFSITYNEFGSYQVLLSINGNPKPLSDFGYGITKIFFLLISMRLNNVLFIEEPETNLHPNFQSKLADLFVKIILEEGKQIIIETHSEYFIRKLQYLVASQKVSSDQILINYFNSSENREIDGIVKEIRIQTDGSLSKDFGPGFFDEALNWKFELMKLKNLN